MDERFAEVRAGVARREDDIYALYAAMRAEAPFWRAPWGDVYLSSWRLVDEALTNRNLSHAVVNTTASPLSEWMLFQEGAGHTALRRAFQGPFMGGDTALARQVEAIVEETLQSVPRNHPIDAVHAFTRTIPERVIGALMGVPEPDLPLLRGWSADLRTALDTGMGVLAKGTASALAAIAGYFEGRLPRAGMFDVAELVAAAGPRTAAANLAFVAFAGHETTVHLLASMLLHLGEAPDVWRALRDTPTLAPAVVSEVLRLESPVQKIARGARDDITFSDGNRVAKGEEVVMLVGAANRDPDRFPNADRIDLARGQTPHLAFGKGVHACLGRALAQMEGEAVLRNLAGRVNDIVLDPSGHEWIANSSFRGLERLMLTLKA